MDCYSNGYKKGFTPTPLNKGMSSRSKRGFTLVELIVSMALFIVVILIVTSAFLTLTNLNEKARTTRAVMDSLSVALENMARNIRIGDTYRCLIGEFLNENAYYPNGGSTTRLSPQNCTNGDRGILFYIPNDSAAGVELVGYYYRNQFDSNPYRIQQFRGGSCCSYLTSGDIKITNLKFYVTDTDSIASGNYNQPRVGIVIQGETGTGDDIQKFNMYSSVTQRIPKE